MKKYILALTFACALLSLKAQTEPVEEEINVGAVLQIGKSVTYGYSHINFPRPNFIIKRGGILNYKNLWGEKVVVTEVYQNIKNETEITLERKNGKKFFRNYKSVKAKLVEALASGELMVQ